MRDAGAPGRYILDTGIFTAFQRTRHLSVLTGISEHAAIVALKEVHEELVGEKAKKKNPKYAEEARAFFEKSRIVVEVIDVSDPAATWLDKLRSGKTSDKDMGEAASIAWAIEHPDAVVVTRDATATFHAVQELRGRTMGLFQFLVEMVGVTALDGAVAGKIAQDAAKTIGVEARLPLWWTGWIQSRASRAT